MKKMIGAVLLLVIFAGVTVIPGAFAAVIVHDPKNTAENHATYLETAKNTLNTSTQIANQVVNLTSVSPETMAAYILEIDEDFESILNTMKQTQGLIKAAQTAQKAWDSAFKQVDTFFDGKTSNIDNLADKQKMIYVLDKTYQDSLIVAKSTDNIEKSAKRLRELMEQNKNAVGNKQVIQTQNNIVAQQNLLQIQQNQTLLAINSAMVAHFAQQNQTEAYATALNQQNIKDCDEIIAKDVGLRKRWGIE